MRPVGIGVPGELWIGGVSLARIYHGRDDLRARVRRRSPRPRRLYRTGDLARFTAAGEDVPRP